MGKKKKKKKLDVAENSLAKGTHHSKADRPRQVPFIRPFEHIKQIMQTTRLYKI